MNFNNPWKNNIWKSPAVRDKVLGGNVLEEDVLSDDGVDVYSKEYIVEKVKEHISKK